LAEVRTQKDINDFCSRQPNGPAASEPEPKPKFDAEHRNSLHIQRIEDLPRIEDCLSAEIEYVVPELIPQGTFVLLTGETGAGKSSFSSALGYAVSKGRPFLGRATLQRPVLVLDRENPPVATRERFIRLNIETGGNFIVWGDFVGERASEVGGAIVMEWIHRMEPKPLIVVESLIRFHPGSENDSTDIAKNVTQYRQAVAAGATVLMHHNTGKAETAQDYRGASTILDSVDIAYKLINTGDPARLERLELRAFKQRISVLPRIGILYRDGEFHQNEQAPPILQTVTEQFAELLQANPGISTKKFCNLAAERNLGRNAASRFLRAGVENGTIEVVHLNHNRNSYSWRGTRVENSRLF
jgi:hypothetical protein